MSRLIDADKLLSYVDRVKNCGLGKKKTIEYITKYINNMLTEFDVDKVVSELEEATKLYEYEPQMNYYKGISVVCERALEIVKRGGIDENRNI